MESQRDFDPSAAADYPRWVILDRGGRWQDSSTADATTSASCYGSTGHAVSVSFCLAAPPALSTLHVVDLPLPGGEISGTYSHTCHVLISAHRDSVLLELVCDYYAPADYFVYSAGGAGAGARLRLLPPCGAGMCVGDKITGILRRGGDEFVVASLVLGNTGGRTEYPVEASMCVFRSGACEWEDWVEIPVRHADGQEAELSGWRSGAVVAVGDRFLCWIDQARGIIFSDMTADIPELCYVPLPADPLLVFTADGNGRGADGCHDPDHGASRNVCVSVAGAVRFVRVSPRCCCGGLGATSCPRSRDAFTVTTWTLRTDDMTWEEDCVLDSGEPWAAAAEEAAGVPLVPPVFPVLSVEDPDVVYFLSSESAYRWRKSRDDADDKTAWMVMVDMRRKTLRSVCRYPEDDDNRLLEVGRQAFLPSEVSSYFNNTACHGRDDNPVPASREDDEEMEVLATIHDIPGMTRDEMLRAHNVLAGDDRRVRFLEALPVVMRKEYCMIMTELERNLKLANDAITASWNLQC